MLSVRNFWLVTGAIIIIVLWVLSLIPHPPTIGFQNEDKLYHLVAYGGTMWWWGQYWRQPLLRLTLAISLALMGVAIEFVQGWTGWRTFDTHDMMANGVGVLFGYALLYTPLGSLFTRLNAYKETKH